MKIKVIYNPVAGNKKRLIKIDRLKQLQELMAQYQLPADFVATKKAGDAILFAKEAVKQKYTHVLAAGGDGTLSEVATGIINTNIILGILPLGTFMNTAKMLSVPMDIEKAIMLIKIGKTRKIDIGQITEISGAKPESPIYFLENSGIGMEAELQKAIGLWEKGDWRQIVHMVRTVFDFYSQKIEIKIDNNKIIKTKASMIEVSNGPWTGAALNMAPDAKLNDHRLTVSVFHMQRMELLFFFLKMLGRTPAKSSKIERHKGQEIQIKSPHPRPVHADASEFGFTPVIYTILPNAINVIAGFIKEEEIPSLKPRTSLDS